jgi:hypothetical protein
MVCPTRSHTKVFLRDWLDLARGKLSGSSPRRGPLDHAARCP